MKNQKLSASFGNAFRGILKVLADGKTVKIELLAAICAIAACFVLKTTSTETCIILLCCAAVLAIECLNSAIEYLVDLVSPEYHNLAKYAKDAAAGSVLLCSFFSAIIGTVIFLPKLLSLISK